MQTFPKPAFAEPLTSVFVYAAWSVDPVRLGPFVRPSPARRAKIDEITAIAGIVGQWPEIVGVRVFEASFIPPLREMPQYDVVMLTEAVTRQAALDFVEDSRVKEAGPARLFLASNAARFGVTDDGDPRASILLNHFTGSSARPRAVQAWRKMSAWFAAKAGIDNSTLLQTEESAPFLMVNYARLPDGVVGFFWNALLRPSFHRYVRALLKNNNLTSLPLFVRPVANGSTHG